MINKIKIVNSQFSKMYFKFSCIFSVLNPVKKYNVTAGYRVLRDCQELFRRQAEHYPHQVDRKSTGLIKTCLVVYI